MVQELLVEALYAARVLEGSLDTELGIARIHSDDKGKQKSVGDDRSDAEVTPLGRKLSSRLEAWRSVRKNVEASSPAEDSLQRHLEQSKSMERQTGWAALLSVLHIHNVLDTIGASASSTASSSTSPPPPLLGSRDIRVIETLIVLIDKWLLSHLLEQFDYRYADLTPDFFPASARSTQKAGRSSAPTIVPSSRFKELSEDELRPKYPEHLSPEGDDHALRFEATCNKICSLLRSCTEIGETPIAQASQLVPTAIPLSVRQVFLTITSVSQAALAIRMAFLPSPSLTNEALSVIDKQRLRQEAGQRLRTLLKSISTLSALKCLYAASQQFLPPHAQAERAARVVPDYVAAVARNLSAAQLLREDGVRALLRATFGNADDGDDSVGSVHMNSTAKLERFAKLLTTPPKGLPASVFVKNVFDQTFAIYADTTGTARQPISPLHIRALTFFVVRVSTSAHTALLKEALREHCYSAFSPKVPLHTTAEEEDPIVTPPEKLRQSIDTISIIVESAEPSPSFVSFLVGPVVPQLYTLMCFLDGSPQEAVRSANSSKVDDRRLSEVVKTLLHTWVRLSDAGEVVESVGSGPEGLINRAQKGIGEHQTVREAEDEDCELYYSRQSSSDDLAAAVCVRYGIPPSKDQDLGALLSSLSAISTSSGSAESAPDFTALQPLLRQTLQPSPAPLVALLKGASRIDVAHDLLMQLLVQYVEVEQSRREKLHKPGDGSTSSILYLHFILQLFEAFGANIVKSPTAPRTGAQSDLQSSSSALLAFIDFALETSRRAAKPDRMEASEPLVQDLDDASTARTSSNALDGLLNIGRTVPNPSTLDTSDFQNNEADEELVSVALSLLLALLEGDTSLQLTNARNPYLLLIASKIPQHLDSPSEEVRALAREAGLVLSVREKAAEEVAAPNRSRESGADAREKIGQAKRYQEALGLLQDPILPVRAHGLVILREMAAEDNRAFELRKPDASTAGAQRTGTDPPEPLEPAIRVAMLDIFLNAVQEDDSYLYLNAIQGLAELGVQADREMFRRLVRLYVGTEASARPKLEESEVDKRLRIGEALLQVVQRGGEAIGPHVTAFVRPLLTTLADRSLPTTLRASTISLLGTCVEACPLQCATTGLSGEMADACLDLVSLETVARPDLSRAAHVPPDAVGGDEDEDESNSAAVPGLDSATSMSTALPQLRRAAMLLLTLLARGTRHQIASYLSIDADESASDSNPLTPAPIRLHRSNVQAFDGLTALRLPNGHALPSLASPHNTTSMPRRAAPTPLLPPRLLERTRTVARYVAQRDTDALVRTQGVELEEEVQGLQVEMLALSGGGHSR